MLMGRGRGEFTGGSEIGVLAVIEQPAGGGGGD